MACFIKTASGEEAAEGLAAQLASLRDRHPEVAIRILPPGEGPEPFPNHWRVLAEAAADAEELKQECLDLLGE